MIFIITVVFLPVFSSLLLGCYGSGNISGSSTVTSIVTEKNNEPLQSEKETGSEDNVQDDTDSPGESVKNDKEDMEIEIDQENIEADLVKQLKKFINAINTDSEYSFFDSYTQKMLKSESEYLKGGNDLYKLLKNNYKSLKNPMIEKIRLHKNRAAAYVIFDKTIDKSINSVSNFQFIYENNSWKLDFYYKQYFIITPISPVPETMLSYPEDPEISIKFRVESFFPISEIIVRMNKKKLEPKLTGDKYDKFGYITVPFPQEEVPYIYDLVLGKNDTVVSVTDVFGEEAEYSWVFYVESIST